MAPSHALKYVFHPDSGSRALARLISKMIGKDVRSIKILPNESLLGMDYKLVILDIVVETEDGSIINVEVQKIGYNFPAERAACYNASLLLRQYERIREEIKQQEAARKKLEKEQQEEKEQEQGNQGNQGNQGSQGNQDNQWRNNAESSKQKEDDTGKAIKFNYRMIHPVYTIVFMEKSTNVFKKIPEKYIHVFSQKSDTGLEMELLQHYLFIPLDIFRKRLSHSGIRTEQDAWLAFLSSDEPAVINEVITKYPDIFYGLYEKICDLCRNTEEVMKMFSKDLEILDKYEAISTIEEQRELIESLQEENVSLQEENHSRQEKIESLQEKIASQQRELEELRKKLTGNG